LSANELADKLAVTELLYRYAELIDAGDFDGVGALLGRGNFMGVPGAEKIAKLFATTTRRFPEHGNTPRTRHLVLNPIGRYSDAFARDPEVPAGWYFTERTVDVQMIGDVSDHLMIDPKQFG